MPPLPPDTTIMQVLPRLDAGGVERGTVEITQAIAAAGGRPLVASAGGRLVPAIERAGGGHVALPLASKSPVTIWRNAARLAAVAKANDVGLIHARSRAPAWSAYRAARRLGLPFVTTYHAPYSENAPGKRRYNSVMARGDRVIAISRHIAELIVQRHQVDPAIIRIIPRGVDPALFDPARIVPDRIARLMRAWRLPDGAPVVMLPARLTRWKGQAVLLRAMARLQHPEAVCVLLGEGRPAYAAELTALAHSLGIADRLRFAGHTDDMPAALMLATVAVSASIEPEGFGRAVIEAQAMGCAVIATNHGGAAETVEDLVTGWHVPPSDPEALAHTLGHALAMSTEDRAGLGQRARASVLQHYTVAQMQAATIAVYNELL
jgi:glycosyltransferase involved in cell wall biosynthesis